MLAGDLQVNGRLVAGPAIVVIEPGSTVTLASRFGCSLLAWAEWPALCADTGQAELYGFN